MVERMSPLDEPPCITTTAQLKRKQTRQRYRLLYFSRKKKTINTKMYVECAAYDIISIRKRHNYLRIIYRSSVRHNNAIDIRVVYTYINVHRVSLRRRRNIRIVYLYTNWKLFYVYVYYVTVYLCVYVCAIGQI